MSQILKGRCFEAAAFVALTMRGYLFRYSALAGDGGYLALLFQTNAAGLKCGR